MVEEIPSGSAAALILLEHRWAVPLRDTVARAGGYRIADGMISPYDLLAIGLASAEEAKQQHEKRAARAAVERGGHDVGPTRRVARRAAGRVARRR